MKRAIPGSLFKSFVARFASGLVASAALVAASGGSAVSEPLEVGGWLGPRVFSDNSRLGQRDVATPGMLTSALELGGRIGMPMLRGQLIPEAELAFALTQTDPFDVGVLWLEPRVALRYLFVTDDWLRPFALIGGGAPIGLSGNTDVFSNHILGEGFLGGGAVLDTGKGFGLRLDARLSFLPGDDPPIAVEVEIGVGVAIPLGARAGARARARVVVADRDRDGVPDDKDSCPDRREDRDGVEDDDGCPDIDNDLDRVLDIADACSMQPEVYNGFEDDDGCPDSVPPELAAIVGPIGGLSFAAGAESPVSSGVAAAAFDRIAKILLANPSVRVRIVGYTDDREAGLPASGEGIELDVPEPGDGDGAPGALDPATVAIDLGYARASSVRELMISRGIPGPRMVADSRGVEEPIADNNTAVGRNLNRRVEVQLLVPQR
jgi:OmpA family